MTTLTTAAQSTSFVLDVSLDGITPKQMASCLAAGGATAPTKIRALTATHESGVVVTVIRDGRGRFDPDHPVFSARPDHCTGELMVIAERALEDAEIAYERYGTRFVPAGATEAMNAAEVLIWVAERSGGAL